MRNKGWSLGTGFTIMDGLLSAALLAVISIGLISSYNTTKSYKSDNDARMNAVTISKEYSYALYQYSRDLTVIGRDGNYDAWSTKVSNFCTFLTTKQQAVDNKKDNANTLTPQEIWERNAGILANFAISCTSDPDPTNQGLKVTLKVEWNDVRSTGTAQTSGRQSENFSLYLAM